MSCAQTNLRPLTRVGIGFYQTACGRFAVTRLHDGWSITATAATNRDREVPAGHSNCPMLWLLDTGLAPVCFLRLGDALDALEAHLAVTPLINTSPLTWKRVNADRFVSSCGSYTITKTTIDWQTQRDGQPFGGRPTIRSAQAAATRLALARQLNRRAHSDP